jgi:hypothetical protein
MRLVPIICAAVLAAALPAQADDWKEEGKDAQGREWKREHKASGEYKEEWKDAHGREWKREVKPQTGEWKEEWKDGSCKVVRERDGSGKVRQSMDC